MGGSLLATAALAGCTGTTSTSDGTTATTTEATTTAPTTTTDTPTTTIEEPTTTEELTTTSDTTATHTRPPTSNGTIAAASNVSKDEAKERSLAAEAEYLTRQFQNATCLSAWDFGGTVKKRATVTNRTADGVYVEVTHPYTYSKEFGRTDMVADVGTNALYVVTAESSRRVRGDNVSPRS
ncbi:hypothetical protein BRC90_01895 [Halobacteriales archaeon QS_4_69_34]|nr:MAG: hypothetical protein BRC90_01895 [Halobacteriales archaeon QS_4_69_34]